MTPYLSSLNVTVTKASVSMSKCKDAQISIGCDTTETAGRTQGAAQEFLPGRKSWSVKVKQLIADTSEASTTLAHLTTGSLVAVTVHLGSFVNIWGNAYVTKIKHNYDCGKVASADITLTGSSLLSHSYNPGPRR